MAEITYSFENDAASKETVRILWCTKHINKQLGIEIPTWTRSPNLTVICSDSYRTGGCDRTKHMMAQNPTISLWYRNHHITLISQRSQCWFYWFKNCFQQGESEALLASSLKLVLEIPVFPIFPTVISKGNLASCTPEATAFICTRVVHVLQCPLACFPYNTTTSKNY